MKNLVAICILFVAFGFMSDLNAQQAQKKKAHQAVIKEATVDNVKAVDEIAVVNEPIIEACKFDNADQAKEALPQLEIDFAQTRGELMAAQKQFYTTENEAEKANLKNTINVISLKLKQLNADLDAARILAKSEQVTAPSRN